MKQLRCKAIIFDLDGVLIDSSAVVQRQWRRWITELGFKSR
jgi:sugar-phosphatase